MIQRVLMMQDPLPKAGAFLNDSVRIAQGSVLDDVHTAMEHLKSNHQGEYSDDTLSVQGCDIDVPGKLYFEISSLCNLSCSMCFRHTWIDEGTGLLDSEIVLQTLEDEDLLKTVHTVFFGGMGEPLTHPDAAEFVAATHSKGKFTELITNGTMLNQKTCRALLEAGLNKLWISMDGFSPDAYENIRVNSRFDLITSNLDTFNREKTAAGREDAQIGITFVASEDNIEELKRLPEFMDLHHITDLNISSMIPNTDALESEVLYDRILGNYYELGQDVTEFRKYDIPAMDLRKEAIREAYTALKPRLNPSRIPADWDITQKPWCRFVNEGNVFVSWDGDVVPCMGLLHSSYSNLFGKSRKVMRHSFGNVYEKSLLEIWKDKDFADFRKRVRDFEFSPCMLCGGCSFRDENTEDCIGNREPTCGACIWAYHVASCP